MRQLGNLGMRKLKFMNANEITNTQTQCTNIISYFLLVPSRKYPPFMTSELILFSRSSVGSIELTKLSTWISQLRPYIFIGYYDLF